MSKFSNFLKQSSWAKILPIFLGLSAVIRTIFLVWQRHEIDFSLLLLVKIYVVGAFFDILAFSYIAALPLLYYTLIPQKVFNSKAHQKFLCGAYFVFLGIIIFSCFAEWFFWEEFQTRFNFIAVDYLIYTTEVVGNINESYPMGKLLSVIALLTAAIFFATYKKIIVEKFESRALKAKKFAVFAAFLLVAFLAVDNSKITQVSPNNYANEAAANGIYELFSAYRNNQINFDELYATIDEKKALAEVRKLISLQEPRAKFLNKNDISRLIPAPKKGSEKKYNIILVSVESLSADFMSAFGNKQKLTPNLDLLAKKGILFTNLKATGTRTVRGLEALTLSVPPTPGNSIVRRSNNENLFNLASPLKARGYEAKFIYGGFGYFDNMNYFYENNGFEIVDRASFAVSEISFANSWGVADEDLFSKTILEADKSHAAGKQFINFVMTTSNHRPFTYPDGRIDIPSKDGRGGAVKYTDYAIGKLIADASKKPWFDNTIFVFVADHCAGSAGNTSVPLWRYQIPTIFYAPKILSPKVFAKNVSQIDIAPTLLGLLNLSYQSKFFGVDVLSNEKHLADYSFVSTYSEVAYFTGSKLFLLKPKKEKKVFDVELRNYGWMGSVETETKNYSTEEMNRAIAFYQLASHLFKNDSLKNFPSK
jgi:phosphoglycerol transferase MdoB-like AlkP superfamily enzyme